MALKSSFVLLLCLAISCLLLTINNGAVKASRNFPAIAVRSGYDLTARLEARGGFVDCWTTLMELKACSSEIVLFFINGETDISPQCCHAIDIITHNCWPAMLTSLGFTAEEGNILHSYCDAASVPVSSPTLYSAHLVAIPTV